ncbi:L-type lectin-domain containing receptor kinase S.4 [Amborella trichopoda]|uniref:L-type lectin-domain containing receptor kinase S.4 n=1 Tax=Amborella trichopoda TaxID=13333 RepID=UPI0009BF407B|nr:L-type lectin-domain containing receptor kinase S.4 [Amborella trichopoda]|eukprot:XP_006846321.3 L-type lectin-domain containing receptor kinase S.4 [Amborella trichopoda]
MNFFPSSYLSETSNSLTHSCFPKPKRTKMLLQILLLFLVISPSTSYSSSFNYSNFHGAKLRLDGVAEIMPRGALQVTNSSLSVLGHAFYPTHLNFKNSSRGNALSFSTTFVFVITLPIIRAANGLAFVISPSTDFRGAISAQYLGLFGITGDGDPKNKVFAVEFDTHDNVDLKDIDDNHVGIDLNSLRSNMSASAAYYITEDNQTTKNHLNLKSGDPIQVWIEYHGIEKLLNVTLFPVKAAGRPSQPLISSKVDLSPILQESMYVGFSASTGLFASGHYVLGWSFAINGRAQDLDLSLLPPYPKAKSSRGLPMVAKIGISLSSVILAMAAISMIIHLTKRQRDEEIVEDWELEYGPHRFSYKELCEATKDFREEELVGSGGFGKVYRGVMPGSRIEVAVKRVANNSELGLRDFLAEISSIGKLRHRNLVPLLGWCKQKTELLIVYDYMSYNSLDKHLFNESTPVLGWEQRHNILKGIASALLYLHEQWEQVVVHRDVKASNILLDADMNGRLGDFGLARVYEHGSDMHTTHVVGTLGYLAPEVSRTGKYTTYSDVFSYGIVLLEAACGRRTVEPQRLSVEVILVDWVWKCFKEAKLLDVVDHRLKGGFVAEEMAMVLRLGLLCSHPVPATRPSMRPSMRQATLPYYRKDCNCRDPAK